MKLLKNNSGEIDVGVAIMIGVIFVALTFMAYVIFKIKDLLVPTHSIVTASPSYNDLVNATDNITRGFDQSVNFLVIAIIIAIVAIAIGALLFIRRE